jgi:DNA-binding transcriptional ArsR family regulator
MAEARLFQALSDPTRLKILDILTKGPLNVTGIVTLVRAAQPAVSRHLRILREVGLIHDRRLGKEVEYSLDTGRVKEACGWLGEFGRVSGRGSVRGETVGGGVRREAARAGGGPDLDGGAESRAGQKPVGQRQTEEGARVGKQVSGARSGGPGKRRLKRVSPLAARGGIAGAADRTARVLVEQEPPEIQSAEKEDAPAGDSKAAAAAADAARPEKTAPRRRARRVTGAGIRSSGGKRRKGPARRKHPSKTRGGGSVEREPDTEPAYVVEREEDPLDDFLL